MYNEGSHNIKNTVYEILKKTFILFVNLHNSCGNNLTDMFITLINLEKYKWRNISFILKQSSAATP